VANSHSVLKIHRLVWNKNKDEGNTKERKKVRKEIKKKEGKLKRNKERIKDRKYKLSKNIICF